MGSVSQFLDPEGFEPSPLEAPPVVLIPGKQIPKHVKESRAMEAATIPVTPVTEEKMEEKIGRWSEEEHKIFLEGLATHGKQWKTISNMIGTRTVVQVRTHAQKYFQKLERKSNKNKAAGAAVQVSISHNKPTKRKSLPTTLPSRKKARSVPSTKHTVSRTASLSLVSVNHEPPQSEISAYVSTSSLSTANWSTESPTGVNELDLRNSASTEDPKEDLFLEDTVAAPPESAVAPSAAVSSSADNADDPLDWLIDGGIGHLPESSLGQQPPPMFPDFSDLSSDQHVLEAQSKTAPSATTAASESNKPFDTSMLQDIGDPKVTVQSLFLDEGDAHLL